LVTCGGSGKNSSTTLRKDQNWVRRARTSQERPEPVHTDFFRTGSSSGPEMPGLMAQIGTGCGYNAFRGLKTWFLARGRLLLGTFLAPGNRPSVPGRTKYSPGSGLASLTVLKIASDLARHKHRLFPAAFLLLSCRFPNDSSSLIPHPLQRWPPALIRSIPLQRSKKGRRVEVTATAGMWESRYGPLRPNKNLP
jgi:hypothetical protein